MRILYIPFYTRKRFELCTTHIVSRMFFEWVLKNNEDVFVYWPIPLPEQRGGYDFPELDHPRVKKIELDIESHLDQARGLVLEPGGLWEMFNDSSGKYMVDAVICDAPLISPSLKARLYTYWTGSIQPAWVNMYPFVVPWSMYSDEYSWLQVASHLCSDGIVWQSVGSRERARKVMLKVLKVSEVEKIMNKSCKTFNTFIDTDRVLKFARPISEKPREQWVVNYGGGVGSSTHEVFRQFDWIFSSGHDVKVIVNASGDWITHEEFARDMSKRYAPYFQITKDLSQEEFWKSAAGAHAFVYQNKTAESSYVTLEMALLGVCGAWIDCAWFREATYEGYPFVGKDELEVATVLRYILEHYFEPEVQEVVEKQRKFVVEKFGIAPSCRGIYEYVKEHVKARFEQSEGKGVEIRQALSQVLQEVETLDWNGVAALVATKVETRNKILTEQKWREKLKSFWKMMFELLGYEDTCQEEMPVFKRRS